MSHTTFLAILSHALVLSLALLSHVLSDLLAGDLGGLRRFRVRIGVRFAVRVGESRFACAIAGAIACAIAGIILFFTLLVTEVLLCIFELLKAIEEWAKVIGEEVFVVHKPGKSVIEIWLLLFFHELFLLPPLLLLVLSLLLLALKANFLIFEAKSLSSLGFMVLLSLALMAFAVFVVSLGGSGNLNIFVQERFLL